MKKPGSRVEESMYAINRKTGAVVEGTLERLEGCEEMQPDGFGRDADGALTHKTGGYTDVYWDNSHTVERDGQVVYIDENGETLTEDDIDLVDELPGIGK